MRMKLVKPILTIGLAFLLSGCIAHPAQKNDGVISVNTEISAFQTGYHYSLGVLLLLDEKSGEAVSEFETALRYDPKSTSLVAELAVLYNEKGEIKKSIELLDNALVNHPRDAELHFLLAGAYINLKDFKNAIAEYRKVIELDPKNVTAYLYLGTLYADQKNYDQSMETFRKVISLDPDDPMGYYYLAKILVELKRYGEAETALKKSMAIKPSFEPTVIDLGFLYQKQKKNALAIDLYRNFITLYPATIKVRIRMGDILLKEKRFDEADRLLKAILIKNPVNQ